MKAIVVGAGHWHAPWHVAALQARGVQIAGVWDADDEAARRRADEWDGSVGTVDELLTAGADVAVLSPRAVDAPELLRALMSARIPVIAEKPLGLSGADVEELATLRDGFDTFVAVSLVNRLSPVWSHRSADGSVIRGDFRIVNGSPQRYLDDGVGWVLDPALGGGGALRNLGIHGADAVCALADGEDLTVESAVLRYADDCVVEVHAAATVRAASGWSATIEAGYVLPDRGGSDFLWRLATSREYIVDRDSEVTVSTDAGTQVLPAPTSAQRYDAFIGRALDDLIHERAPLVGLGDAARAACLVDAVYAAAIAAPHPDRSEGAR